MRAESSILPLRAEGVEYRIGKDLLLSDITLEIVANRTLILLGANGAGKSLFLRLCHGLLRPTKGKILWNVPDGRPQKQAMVFQTPVLLRRSARANIAHALNIRGIARRIARKRADDALERFGLTAIAARPARLLSGGEQQRLAIARAWVTRPQILFLDEPTAHLDPGATHRIEGMLQSLRDDGITLFMATHDIAQAGRLADDVAMFHRGRLIETAPASGFFQNSGTELKQAFLGGRLIW